MISAPAAANLRICVSLREVAADAHALGRTPPAGEVLPWFGCPSTGWARERLATVDRSLRPLDPFGVERLDRIRRPLDERLRIVGRREVGEHVVGERPWVATLRAADADAKPHELRRLQVLGDRAKAVVPAEPSADLEREAAEVEVAFVVHDEDGVRIELVEPLRSA